MRPLVIVDGKPIRYKEFVIEVQTGLPDHLDFGQMVDAVPTQFSIDAILLDGTELHFEADTLAQGLRKSGRFVYWIG